MVIGAVTIVMMMVTMRMTKKTLILVKETLNMTRYDCDRYSDSDADSEGDGEGATHSPSTDGESLGFL